MTVRHSPRLPPLGLYLHIPFCERKCPYCDFNTYAGLHALHQDMVDALCREMEQRSADAAGRTVVSIFIGGGTPTVLTPAQLEQLLTAIRTYFQVASAAEISCEANPGAVDRERFVALRRLGVNRLSMGVQSFQPEELKFLGRIHDVADVYAAFDAARDAGFDNINLDFIFGLPQQPLTAWSSTLDKALALAPEHLSLYSLIVEPNTPLEHWVHTGQVEAPDDDNAADHYELAMVRLAAGGYWQYEVSNWAQRGAGEQSPLQPKHACRHNLLYWRNEDYLGIGPGAHSHLRTLTTDGNFSELRWGNQKPVAGYVKRMRVGTSVVEFTETIDERLAMGETMMLGLRLIREGVPGVRFSEMHGCTPEAVFKNELASLRQRGLVTRDEDAIRLTPAGLMVGNRVFAEFLPD